MASCQRLTRHSLCKTNGWAYNYSMKVSSGLLVYRYRNNIFEVLLAHPGGPFWANKDDGAWTIPKGEVSEDEDPLAAARREFEEEIGQVAPRNKSFYLDSIKRRDGKVIHVWAVQGDLDASAIQSNMFTVEWPPKSGKKQEFPEIDKAAWFELSAALPKLHKGQPEFIKRLAEHLGAKLNEPEKSPQQSLF